MRITTVAILALAVFDLKVFGAGAAYAQRIPAADMSTGDGGPIQEGQYGPPLGQHWPPLGVGKGPAWNSRQGYVRPPEYDGGYGGGHRTDSHSRHRRRSTMTVQD